MDDILIVDAIERWRNGEMGPEEKLYFDEMRGKNPQLDQMVVDHLFFLNQIDSFRETKQFKHNLAEVQNQLAEEGFVKRTNMPIQGKVVSLWAKYKRVIGVAASIAGVVSVLIASVVSSISTNKTQSLTPLVKELRDQQSKTRQIESKLNQLQANVANAPGVPEINAKFMATGFLIDAANDYLVTNAHVLSEAKNHLIVENNQGIQYLAKPVYVNNENDLAIIRVTDSAFTKLPPPPYTIRKKNADLGEEVFILGFPKQEIVYSQGYVSAKNGSQMDTLYCQLSTDAAEGSSGSPVITKNGEVIGIVTSKETNAASVVYAIKSVNIHRAVEEAKKADSHQPIKVSGHQGLRGMDRVSQIKGVENYVFMVKGN